jgi:cathepsin L
MYRIVVLIFALISCSAGTIFQVRDFDSFKKIYSKWYSLEEESFRRTVFEDNLKKIDKLNDLNPKAKFVVTALADLTIEEQLQIRPFSFKAQNISERYIVKPDFLLQKPVNASYLPEIDWRTRPGFVSPVKDQGPCGTCWSYGAVGTVEGAIANAGLLGLSLSSQHLIDCAGNDGLDGGPYSINWISRNGISEFSKYPTNPAQACQTPCNPPPDSHFAVGGVRCLNNCGPEQDVLNLLQYGPVVVSLAANTLFAYQGGVITNCADPDINHSVLLVGYSNGLNGDGPHWIIKNSWGYGFGEQGYFRTQYGVNCLNMVCGGDCQAV